MEVRKSDGRSLASSQVRSPQPDHTHESETTVRLLQLPRVRLSGPAKCHAATLTYLSFRRVHGRMLMTKTYLVDRTNWSASAREV